MTKSLVFAVGLFAVVAINGVASAQAVEWKVSDGGNGHWYALYRVVGDTQSPEIHFQRASDLGAHTATISSSAENDFVFSISAGTGALIGVRKELGNNRGAWITSEAWGYSNWNVGEGNNYWERYVLLNAAWNGKWQDTDLTPRPTSVIEWDSDCNSDGIVDYGQIRRGELADFNGNNVPDCCEQGSSCTVGTYPVQWKVSDGGNGHWYQVRPKVGSWTECQALAGSLGGHLATLGTVSESDFVEPLIPPQNAVWNRTYVGGRQAAGAVGDQGWYWIDGTPWSYTRWEATQPNGGEGFLVVYRDRVGSSFVYQWGDYGPDDPDIVWCLIEWTADCNGDGNVDYGQILRGELADLNVNGVPDLCESVIRVPADKASIQAAIDAATPGKIVEVSPGIYNEAIDLKGKAITVKAVGARANTIIDGTGKTTSVVCAVTGETSATVLQGFTIRNGPIGSPVNTYRLGGGMFIDHASPTIRDCAFVNNAAGYGGGIYGRYSDSLVENCTFSQNAASTDGGGVQFFAGSPVVRGCTISDNLSTNRGGGLHLVQHTTGGFPTVDGCTITGNRTSVSEGGGVSLYPLNGAAQKPLVSNCTIQGNTAQGRGGGLYAPVSATAPQPNATLVSNTICGNTSSISKRENTWALFEDGGNAICDCFSDIDGSGSVNTGDLGFALLFVGDVTDPDYIQPDQDMNGVVDTGDIALLLLNFGQCP